MSPKPTAQTCMSHGMLRKGNGAAGGTGCDTVLTYVSGRPTPPHLLPRGGPAGGCLVGRVVTQRAIVPLLRLATSSTPVDETEDGLRAAMNITTRISGSRSVPGREVSGRGKECEQRRREGCVYRL